MKLLTAIIEAFRKFFNNDHDDAYTEYLSEKPGIYVNIRDVYED